MCCNDKLTSSAVTQGAIFKEHSGMFCQMQVIVFVLFILECVSMKVNTLPSMRRLSGYLVSNLLSFGPVSSTVRNIARNAMVQRGNKINVNWEHNVALYKMAYGELQRLYEGLVNASIAYPDYYVQRFHAYDEGNLSWQAAMEVESAALTVHAQIFTPPNQLDRNGDAKLRQSYGTCRTKILSNTNVNPEIIVDVGCSTGLSTMELHQTYPKARVCGIDLSPYMLSVAQYNLRKSVEEHVTYSQCAAECTHMQDNSVDLVSNCLVMHELPQSATASILAEAYRILRKGGAVAIMDMDPQSETFRNLSRNPFAFAGFKSTEPWLEEYMSLDLVGLLTHLGFAEVSVVRNSPRHRTIVAFK